MNFYLVNKSWEDDYTSSQLFVLEYSIHVGCIFSSWFFFSQVKCVRNVVTEEDVNIKHVVLRHLPAVYLHPHIVDQKLGRNFVVRGKMEYIEDQDSCNSYQGTLSSVFKGTSFILVYTNHIYKYPNISLFVVFLFFSIEICLFIFEIIFIQKV